jgi:hypothetical protein
LSLLISALAKGGAVWGGQGLFGEVEYMKGQFYEIPIFPSFQSEPAFDNGSVQACEQSMVQIKPDSEQWDGHEQVKNGMGCKGKGFPKPCQFRRHVTRNIDGKGQYVTCNMTGQQKS